MEGSLIQWKQMRFAPPVRISHTILAFAYLPAVHRLCQHARGEICPYREVCFADQQCSYRFLTTVSLVCSVVGSSVYVYGGTSKTDVLSDMFSFTLDASASTLFPCERS